MASRALPLQGRALGTILVFLLAMSNVGLAAAGCFTVNAAVTAAGTITITDRSGFTAVPCAAGKTGICDCMVANQPLLLPLKMCADNQTHAEDLYIAKVLPKLQSNFDPDVYPIDTSGSFTAGSARDPLTRFSGSGAWAHNKTLDEKFKCVLKSGKTAKDAVCNVHFIYKSNGVKECTGADTDVTCTMESPSCLALENNLWENCATLAPIQNLMKPETGITVFSSKGAPSLGLLAKSSSNQEDVQFDGEAMCKYPSALKCFKQTADVEVKPTFCSSKVPVKGILNVCAYDVARANAQRDRIIEVAESALVTDDDCKTAFTNGFCGSRVGATPVAKCDTFYCRADTLFSDFYSPSTWHEMGDGNHLSLFKKSGNADLSVIQADANFLDGISDVDKGRWGVGCQVDADCRKQEWDGTTVLHQNLPTRAAGANNLPCCSVFKDLYKDVCTVEPEVSTNGLDKWPWEEQSGYDNVPPCKNDGPCTPLVKPPPQVEVETTPIEVSMEIGYTAEEFKGIQDEFKKAIAQAVGAPDVSAVFIKSFGRRAGSRVLLAEGITVVVKLSVPKNNVDLVKSKLSVENINSYLKKAGLKEVSEVTIVGESASSSASVHSHGGPLFMALATLCSLLAASVGQ